MTKKKFFNTRDLVLASMFVALSIVFATFSINLSVGLRLSVKQTPIILSGIILGPVWGLIVGILGDIGGFLVKPVPPYMPGITLTSALIGFIPGLIHKYIFKKNILFAIVVSVLIDMLILNGILGTYFISITYGHVRNFQGWLISRMPTEGIMCVVQTLLCAFVILPLKSVIFKNKDIKKLEENI